MATKISSESVAIMSPEEIQKQARMDELNEKIGRVTEQFKKIIEQNKPLNDGFNKEIMTLIPFS